MGVKKSIDAIIKKSDYIETDNTQKKMKGGCCLNVVSLAGPQGISGLEGVQGPTGPAGPLVGLGTVVTPLTVNVAIPSAAVPTNIVSASHTFPAVGGPWRALGSYCLCYNTGGAGPISVSSWITETSTNSSIAFDQKTFPAGGINGGNAASQISLQTYSNGQTVTFFLRALTTLAVTALPNSPIANPAVGTNMTISAVPA